MIETAATGSWTDYKKYLPKIPRREMPCLEEVGMLIGVAIALAAFVVAVVAQYALFVQLGLLLCACILYLSAHYMRRYPQYRILVEQNEQLGVNLQAQRLQIEDLSGENAEYKNLNKQHREQITTLTTCTQQLAQRNQEILDADKHLKQTVTELDRAKQQLSETIGRNTVMQEQLQSTTDELGVVKDKIRTQTERLQGAVTDVLQQKPRSDTMGPDGTN